MADYSSRVVPIGLLYALSLWLSNSSYLYLSVSFIQVSRGRQKREERKTFHSARPKPAG